MGRPTSSWWCSTILLLVVILLNRLGGASGSNCRCPNDSDFAEVNCASAGSGMTMFLTLRSSLSSGNYDYRWNCSGEGNKRGSKSVSFRVDPDVPDITVNDTKKCTISGSLSGPFPQPTKYFGPITCMAEDPLTTAASTSSPTTMVPETSSSVAAPDTPSYSVSPSSPVPRTSPIMGTPLNPVELHGDRGSPTVILVTVILCCVALLLLLPILLLAVWCGWSWKKKHSVIVRREALNKLFCGSNYVDANPDNSYVFVGVVAPATTMSHSHSTVTILNGLSFERNGTGIREDRDNNLADDSGTFNPFSDVGYVNDGLHPMSFSEESQGGKMQVGFSTEELKKMRRLSSDDVFLPGTTTTISSSSRAENSDSNGGIVGMNFHHSFGSEDDLSNRYFKAEDRKDDRLRHCHPEEQTYVDYNKIVQASFPSTSSEISQDIQHPLSSSNVKGRDPVGEVRYTEFPVSLTNTDSKSSCGHPGIELVEHSQRQTDISNNFPKDTCYDSTDIMVLLTDTPPPDDSGFKSQGDALSMISI